MNMLRPVIIFTGYVALLYAALGLFISLRDFGVGMAVAAACYIGQDLCTYIDTQRRDRHTRMLAARRRHPSTRWTGDQP